MSEGIRLQNRDIELLIFLGKYKIISLDNTRYIYETVTYQEKRIVALAKHNYIRRLKHRYITLGTKGKEYLSENRFQVREHCRNENNIERLKVISDIASSLIQHNLDFIPSWEMKNEDEPTTHSRRYIGKLEYNELDEFLVYAIYDGKDDKYIKSVYYDIRKENGRSNIMIFTNNIEKIILHEKGFYFGNEYTILIPYDECGKFLVRNNYKVRHCTYLMIKEMYNAELTDFKFADLKIDDCNYAIIMPLINMETIARLHCYFDANESYKNIYIFGLEENEEAIKELADLTFLNFKSTDFESQMKELTELISPTFKSGEFKGQLKDLEHLTLADFMSKVRENATAEVLVEFETTDKFEQECDKVIMAYQKYLIEEIQANGYSNETLKCISYRIDLDNKFKNGIGIDTVSKKIFKGVEHTLGELQNEEQLHIYAESQINTLQEGKSGLTDCMEDDTIRTSEVQEATHTVKQVVVSKEQELASKEESIGD